MADQDDQNKSSISGDILSQKDITSFKNMMDFYNFKNYKKSLKIAESLLAKYPNHGETLSVKALLLLFLEPSREDEIIELAKNGLRNGINSYLCWHVLGVIYKHVKRYKDTVKCFIMALKLDPHNDRLLKELCCLQIELNDYQAFRRFGSTLLKLRSKEYREWALFAFSNHLCENLSISSEIMEESDRLFSSNYRVEDYELSESIMYRGMLYEHLGEFDKCAKLLEDKVELLKDKLSYLELKAKALYLAGKREFSHVTYRELIELNPNNFRFVFMSFVTHSNEKVRKLFFYPSKTYERPEKGSIYDERLIKDSKEFEEKNFKFPENQDYAILLSDELLDIDGEYSSAGWSLETMLYHNFDKYINNYNTNKDSVYFGCYNYPEYAFRVSKKLDLRDLPLPDSVGSLEDATSVLDEYLNRIPGSDLVVYSKYRRFLKRDKYPLFMFTRKLSEEEEVLLLECLDQLGMKDTFTYKCFEFLFSSGKNFYERAKKLICLCLDRGATNIFRFFDHCLTFRKAYVLLLLLSNLGEKLLKGERADDLKGKSGSSFCDHQISCNYRLHLVTLFQAKLYDFMGAYRKALDALKPGFKVTPTSVDLYCMRGKILRHLGDYSGSNRDFCIASDIDRSDRQTSAKSSKSILRTYDFEFAERRWKMFLREDVCLKNDKEVPPEIPSFKFELMYARAKYDLYLKSTLGEEIVPKLGEQSISKGGVDSADKSGKTLTDHIGKSGENSVNDHVEESNSKLETDETQEKLSPDNVEDQGLICLKESFERYRMIMERTHEMYHNQLDFHNYCLNRLAYRVYYNFLKLRNVYCSQGYYMKALKWAIRCSMELYSLGEDTELEVENKTIHKNLSYCLEEMNKVLSQRVFDPGLFRLFYKLGCLCDMNLSIKLQCMTRCYYASRCNKLNYHLVQIVYGILENLRPCSDFELEMAKKSLNLCVDEEVGLDFEEYDEDLCEKYLNYLLSKVLENYEFKGVKALVLCSYNEVDTNFLEKLFENSRVLYKEITFKDYLRFKRFFVYVVNSCTIEDNKKFLKQQMDIMVEECVKEFEMGVL